MPFAEYSFYQNISEVDGYILDLLYPGYLWKVKRMFQKCDTRFRIQKLSYASHLLQVQPQNKRLHGPLCACCDAPWFCNVIIRADIQFCRLCGNMFNEARLVKYELLERNRKTRANKSLPVFQCSLNCIDYAKLKDCVDLLYYDTV